MKEAVASKPLFRDLAADDPDPETTEIESLCMYCGENGMTRLLLTKIPFYKEVILMSFECQHCGNSNNEIQSGGKIQEKGVKLTLHVKTHKDLNRQVAKSDHASIRIPEVDFEIPAQSQKGEITTVEGILSRCIFGLEQEQPKRHVENPEAASSIDAFLVKMKGLKQLETPFTLVLEDISGDSFIENPNAPHIDPLLEIHYFTRTTNQDHELGMYEPQNEAGQEEEEGGISLPDDFREEVLRFDTNCPNCNSPCDTNMKLTKIPRFKEVVIMSTSCDACGNRTNEVKGGSGMEPQGKRYSLAITDVEDLNRDVLKSETCSIEIPELELEVGPSTLGGRFTTVEGLLVAMKNQLAGKDGGFLGDSTTPEAKRNMEIFLSNIAEVIAGEMPVTLVLDDPAGNTFIQSLNDEGAEDSKLKSTVYERTFEQNDELGLNDMKTENYESS